MESERGHSVTTCECLEDQHWESLRDLTVVVVTRDRPMEVGRLLRSLANMPCSVDVYDNGREAIPRNLRSLSERQTYTYQPADYPSNLQSASYRIRTSYVCMVDDDGLLQPHGVGEALCLLRECREAVAVEGHVANFVRQNGKAFFYLSPESIRDAELLVDPITRLAAVMGNFSSNPWYAIHRTESFAQALLLAGSIEAISTSRNVSPQFFVALTAASGPIIKCPRLVGIREDSLAPHDLDAYNIWCGDWLADANFTEQVREVFSLMRVALESLGMSAQEVEDAQTVIRASIGIHSHPSSAGRTGRRERIARLVRGQSLLIRRRRASQQLDFPLDQVDEPVSIVLSDVVTSGEPSIIEPAALQWDSRDAQLVMSALGIQEVIVVRRPKDLPGYMSSRTGLSP